MNPLSEDRMEKLVQEYGCPVYLCDEEDFIKNYERLQDTFRAFYPRYHISYSYKTNYTPYICALVKRLGGYAEVVSGMERHIARKLGYEDARVIFNGPEKGPDGIESVQNGGMVNVDSLDELRFICVSVRNLQGPFQIGLRVNLDVGQPFISRFGMDENEIAEAFSIVSSVPNLDIVGLHCHISRCRGLKAWEKRTRTMLSLADRYFVSLPPKYIDLGSGMFGQMDPELEAQFEDVPSYRQYAEVTAGILAEHYRHEPEESKPLLFTEPGTTLINKYIDLIARVDGIKTIRGKHFIVVNASEQNLGETCRLKKLPIRVTGRNPDRKFVTDADIVGYTCLEQDVLYTGFNGEIGIGDYIRFGNVGGYSNVYKPPFILPNCAMVALRSTGYGVIMKKAETYEDLMRTYVF